MDNEEMWARIAVAELERDAALSTVHDQEDRIQLLERRIDALRKELESREHLGS